VPRHTAFLRGINLGGRRVKSPDLAAGFEAMGFDNVSVFLASGNVVFVAKREPVPKLTFRVEAGLAEALGYDVAVFLRTEKEVSAIAQHEPFPAVQVDASKGKLQVAMLPGKPLARARKHVLALATDEDRLAFGGLELYWLPSGGTVDSELDLKAIDKQIGPATWRTKKTVERISAKYFSD
jgi:uncharacterized protein (DUF1697 family)